MKSYKIYFLIIPILSFFGCEPFEEPKPDIGGLPNPSFTITDGSTPNEFILNNTTEGAFLTSWDLGDFGTANGQEAIVTIPFAGDYDVTMTTFAKGGSASQTKTITVATDDPNACFGNFELLTGCEEKTWVLAPEAGAIHVGPDLVDIWWNNNDDDVIDRECHFNDQYIFRANGEYEYKNNGDYWADTDGDGNIFPADLGVEPGCQLAETLPEAYQSWGDGLHSFNINESTLTVSGMGAWMGLYKIGTNAEVGTPQSSVTFNILELSNDRMVLYTDYVGLVWRVTFVAQ